MATGAPTSTATTAMEWSAAEDSDPVVREIDVFVAPVMGENLYLLQHPLRPQWRPYGMEQMEHVKVKPLQRRLELSIPLDVKGYRRAPACRCSNDGGRCEGTKEERKRCETGGLS